MKSFRPGGQRDEHVTGEMQKNRLTVSILGSTFTIKSENDPEYLGEVVEYLRMKIEEIRQRSDISDPLKVSLLTALNLVDELFKAKQPVNPGETKDSVEIEKLTERLINKIDESLMGN